MCFNPCLGSVLFTDPSLLVVSVYRIFFNSYSVYFRSSTSRPLPFYHLTAINLETPDTNLESQIACNYFRGNISMVIRFAENCTEEEREETCRCLSQLFHLASNLPKPCKIPDDFRRKKLTGVPIPKMIFQWQKRANWPDYHHSRSGYTTPERFGHESPLIDRRRPSSLRLKNDRQSTPAFDRAARSGSMRECKSHTNLKEASPFQLQRTTATATASSGASTPSSFTEMAGLTAAGNEPEIKEKLSDLGDDFLSMTVSSHQPCQQELMVSHAVHSKENKETHEREFYFDVQDKHEYHVYVRRHSLVWETPKQVRGEICSSVATGVITWRENDTMYTCDLFNKEFRWMDGSGIRRVFNVITGQ